MKSISVQFGIWEIKTQRAVPSQSECTPLLDIIQLAHFYLAGSIFITHKNKTKT